MALYEASIDKEWEDFTNSGDFAEAHEISHEAIRKNLEIPIKEFINDERQDLFALWGPYGQGKTQLMYHLFKYAWKNGGLALFTKLERLLPKDEMDGSDQFKEYIEKLVKESITKIKNSEIDEVDLLNNECKSWLKNWLEKNPIQESLEDHAILLIDEMEENYRALLDRVKAEENSPLKACTAQDSFMIIAAFAPTSQYEAMTGEAEKRRWKPFRLPTLSAEVLRERNAEYGNFAWWVSKGRLGLAFKILDVLQSRPLNDFKDFEEFAIKDIGSIAKVPSIDTSELAKCMEIKDYLIELCPHSEVNHKKGLANGRIIRVVEFVNTLKDGLKEEEWEAKKIEIFGDYLKYVISALSNDKGFLFPQENDGNDPKRILTLLEIAVDFAIEIEGRNETIISAYDKIYKWKNFEHFYYTKLLPRISSLDSIDGSVVSYDLLPKLFPLPITSPIIGDIPIKQCRENLLTSHPPTGYLAQDIETLQGGQIVFFYFINNQKLKQFLNSIEVKDFLPSDSGLVCIVLEDREEIRLDGVAGWLKTQNRIEVEYPSISLRNFLISFMNYYQPSFQDKELRSILQEKVEEEFKQDKTLHRRLNHHKNILDEFIKFKEKNLVLSREKFEVKNKEIIHKYRPPHYEKFSDVVGLSFCTINELSTFHAFKQIVRGSDELRELHTGVPGLLKDVSVGKVGHQPLRLNKPLEIIKDSYTPELNDLRALANLVSEGDFIKLSSEENSKEVLRGIFKYVKPSNYDKSLIIQGINDVIDSVEKLTKSREEINKTFGGFEVKESKSERTKEKWSGILAIVGELNGGYLEYLVCSFANAILDKFKDDILSKDQNWLTEWQKNTQYVENYNENLIKMDNLEHASRWLNTDKNKMKAGYQERYFEIVKGLTNFQNEVDFNAVDNLDNLNWDLFNEELERVNSELCQIMEIEEKLKEVVATVNEINRILGGEKL